MKNWKIITIAGLIILIGIVVYMGSFEKPPAYTPVMFYNKNGIINKISKIFTDTLTASTGNAYSVDISAAGFANISSINIMAERNTGTATSVPNVAIKSFTNSAVVVNVIEGNGTLVTILGLSVLSGASTQFAAGGIKLHIQVLGN